MKMCIELTLLRIDAYKIFILMHLIFVFYDNYPYFVWIL